MSDNLVKRPLIYVDNERATIGEGWQLTDEAADEIERLRADHDKRTAYINEREAVLTKWRERAERLQAERDKLQAHIDALMLEYCEAAANLCR